MPIIIAPIGRRGLDRATLERARREIVERAREPTEHASSRPGSRRCRGRLATPSSSVVVEFIIVSRFDSVNAVTSRRDSAR